MSIIQGINRLSPYTCSGFQHGVSKRDVPGSRSRTNRRQTQIVLRLDNCCGLGNSILVSCPWGPITEHGVDLLPEMYAIYMESYASRYASAWEFFHIWHFSSNTGTLPILPDYSRGSPLSSYNIWLNAKYNWLAAKSTPPDPHRSQLTSCLVSVTKIGPEKAHFRW